MFVTKVWNMGRYMEHMLSALPGERQEGIVRAALQAQASLHLHPSSSDPSHSHPHPLSQYVPSMTLADKAILLQLHRLVLTVTHALMESPPGDTIPGGSPGPGVALLAEAGKAVQEFLRAELADWYIEVG